MTFLKVLKLYRRYIFHLLAFIVRSVQSENMTLKKRPFVNFYAWFMMAGQKKNIPIISFFENVIILFIYLFTAVNGCSAHPKSPKHTKSSQKHKKKKKKILHKENDNLAHFTPCW